MKTKNLATFKTLAALAALTTTSFAATIVGFTAGEGYANGDLNNNNSWNVNAATNVFQVNATAGTVTSTSADVNAAANFLTAPPSKTEQIFTMNFSYTAGTFSPTVARAVVRLTAQSNKNITFNQGVNASFVQSIDKNSFNIGIFENPNGGSSPPSGLNFSGELVGLFANETNDGFSDNVSDQLRFTLTNTYTGANNRWNTTAELYNLTTDAPVKSLDHLNWLANDDYLNFDKLLRFDNQQLSLLGDNGASSVTISQVAIIPEISGGAMVGALALGLALVRRR